MSGFDVTQSPNFADVMQVLKQQLGFDDSVVISADTEIIEDLGADSLDAVEVVMALEDALGIEIPDDAQETMKTVGDIIAYIDTVRNVPDAA